MDPIARRYDNADAETRTQWLMLFGNLLYGLGTLAVVYAVLFAAVSSPAFPLKEIKVEGHLTHISREQVQYIAQHAMRGNFFTLNLDTTRQAFEKLPWVREVSVRRRWPGMLVVSIEEHQALARWGETALVNTQGEVFEAQADLQHEKQLPEFIGPEGTSAEVAQAYSSFGKQFAPLKIAPVKLELSPRRAWKMTLSNGMQLNLGRDSVEERLARFVHIYPKSFAGRGGLQYVDLRYTNGLAIRLSADMMKAFQQAKPGTKPIPPAKAGTKPTAPANAASAKPAAPANPAGSKPVKPKTDHPASRALMHAGPKQLKSTPV